MQAVLCAAAAPGETFRKVYDMSETKMRLVGGPPKRLPMSCYEIRKAEASDTRLMGVVGLHLYWVLKPDTPEEEALAGDFIEPVRDVHQVYCFELEDGGLDRVSELEGNDTVKLGKMKNGVFGGLGGSLKRLSSREALWLIFHWAGDEALSWQKMTKGVREVFDMAKEQQKASPMTKAEIDDLDKRLCVPIETDYGMVNYFIMRSVTWDREGAELLISPFADRDEIEDLRLPRKASLIRNRSDRPEDGGPHKYLCESFLDTEAGSFIMISEVVVGAEGIIGAKKKQVFKVSQWETYRKLLRSEFVTHYTLAPEFLEEFDEKLSRAIPRASCKSYDNGVLYMDYFTDNRHAENRIFNIGDDLKASYFLTPAGDLLAASFSSTGIMAAETMVRISGLADYLTPAGRYSFTSPVLGQFVESGYDDFDEFLHLIT